MKWIITRFKIDNCGRGGMEILKKIPADGSQYIEIVKSLWKNFADKPYKLLEVGAGNHLLKGLIPKNITYHGMDCFGEQEYVFNLDSGKFPIKDGAYDIVVCTETLEHTMYPERIILEIKRVARKGATFYLSLPNEYNFLQRIYFVFGKKTFMDETFYTVEKHLHIHKPRVKDIIALFTKHFSIKKVHYVWESLHGSHGTFKWVFRTIDRLIEPLAKINPELFTRLVLVICQ